MNAPMTPAETALKENIRYFGLKGFFAFVIFDHFA